MMSGRFAKVRLACAHRRASSQRRPSALSIRRVQIPPARPTWEAEHEIRRGEWQKSPPAIDLYAVPQANRRQLSARHCNAALLLQSKVLRRSPQERRLGKSISGEGGGMPLTLHD